MQKLRKVLANYKTNKKYMSLRGSGKVPDLKSSCSRLKYSMFLVSLSAMINTEERTLTASTCVVVVELT